MSELVVGAFGAHLPAAGTRCASGLRAATRLGAIAPPRQLTGPTATRRHHCLGKLAGCGLPASLISDSGACEAPRGARRPPGLLGGAAALLRCRRLYRALLALA
eukprot:10115116-Alexandrium_andersonii.AAC.1